MSGAQIGLVNISQTMTGVQLGLVNIITRSDALVFCPSFNAPF